MGLLGGQEQPDLPEQGPRREQTITCVTRTAHTRPRGEPWIEKRPPAECGPQWRGILPVWDGRLHVDAPPGLLTPEWHAALAANEALLLAAMAGPPWAGQRVPVEDLPDFKARWGLRTVGGDPDLAGEPWMPRVYLVED